MKPCSSYRICLSFLVPNRQVGNLPQRCVTVTQTCGPCKGNVTHLTLPVMRPQSISLVLICLSLLIPYSIFDIAILHSIGMDFSLEVVLLDKVVFFNVYFYYPF